MELENKGILKTAIINMLHMFKDEWENMCMVRKEMEDIKKPQM